MQVALNEITIFLLVAVLFVLLNLNSQHDVKGCFKEGKMQ